MDYKGLKVPEVTELRRQIRGARGDLQGRQEHAGDARDQRHAFESLTQFFVGTTAVAYSGEDPVALAKVLTTFAKTRAGAADQGRGRARPRDQDRRGHRAGVAAGEAGAVRQAALRAAGADGAAGERAERPRARPDERARAGGEEEERSAGRRRGMTFRSRSRDE